MEQKQIDWVVFQPEDVVIVPDPSTILEVSRETDEMWDTHGFIQNWYNPCVREKFSTGNVYLPPISDSDGELINFGETSPSFRDIVRLTVPFLDNAQIDELSLRSEEALSNVVDMNMSIINFLIELIQLITGNIKIVKRFGVLYERCAKAYASKWKQLMQDPKYVKDQVAARWLCWNFAVKPFISDLQALVCSLTLANRKMAWLSAHNHKVTHLDYVRKDLGDLISFDPEAWVGNRLLFSILKADPAGSPVNGAYQQQVRYHSVKLSYRARSKIFLDIPDEYLEGARGLTVLWSAMQGISNPLYIVWEAIPFTWLIDYFLSYRARLFQRIYDMNPYNEGVHVLGYGHSYKLEVSGAARLRNVTQSQTIPVYGRFQYSVYSREAGLPYVEQTTLFRVPDSWYKGSILAAIGSGIRPGRRRG